ncbi:hypothetical protein AGMMS49975_05840 [Clostridia bacterium]|nr:hypothetical protein AGMMS49975_05840 [Clostridia bacterium]
MTTTIRKANDLIRNYQGYGKEDKDFTAMLHELYNAVLSLLNGEVEYNSDMTSKHYFYKVVEDKTDDETGEWYEGRTVGYLSAYKCFVRGLDEPYEILAYVS